MSFRIRRRGASSSAGPNYLASVSDLMCALLFIFIITLALAALQARNAQIEAEMQNEIARSERIRAEEARKLADKALAEAEESRMLAEGARVLADEARKVAKNRADELLAVQHKLTSLEARLVGNDRARRGLLESIQAELDRRFGIHVNVDAARGVLRIPENAVTFAVGSAALDAANESKVRDIGTVLREELACFTAERLARAPQACRARNPNGNTLDAVFVEGHTDNQAYRGDMNGSRNLLLSTARSNTVYQILRSDDGLARLRNDKGEVLFSLSGYGAERPVPGHFHEKAADDAANRRIELRFILTEPKMTEEERTLTKRAGENAEDENKDRDGKAKPAPAAPDAASAPSEPEAPALEAPPGFVDEAAAGALAAPPRAASAPGARS